MRDVIRNLTRGIGLMAVVCAFSSVVRADEPVTPEIDAGMMAGALTLLSGAALIVKDRIRRK